jgi:hypothetical protein
MKLPRVRFTVRRLMVVVVVAAILSGYAVFVRSRYLDLFETHAIPSPQSGSPVRPRIASVELDYFLAHYFLLPAWLVALGSVTAFLIGTRLAWRRRGTNVKLDPPEPQ